MNDSFRGREENDHRNDFMIKLVYCDVGVITDTLGGGGGGGGGGGVCLFGFIAIFGIILVDCISKSKNFQIFRTFLLIC